MASAGRKLFDFTAVKRGFDAIKARSPTLLIDLFDKKCCYLAPSAALIFGC